MAKMKPHRVKKNSNDENNSSKQNTSIVELEERISKLERELAEWKKQSNKSTKN
jgi:uncharacterized small protein (DUF1192 family)